MLSFSLLVSIHLFSGEVGRALSQRAGEPLQNQGPAENSALDLSVPGCDCCPGLLPSNPTFPLKDCKASCNVAYQGDCFCNKNFHPTGCTLKDCTAADGNTTQYYTCYCTATYAPYDCVARPNSNNPLCAGDGDDDVPANCQCNSELHDPDNCTIRECNPNEATEDGYRCVCGESCNQKPDGCVKIAFDDNITEFVDDIVDGLKR